MIKVATKYHHTSSDSDELPKYKCTGTCEKVYWAADVEPLVMGEVPRCGKCGGVLKQALEWLDYSVLELTPGKRVHPNFHVNHLSDLQKEFIHLQELYGWK